MQLVNPGNAPEPTFKRSDPTVIEYRFDLKELRAKGTSVEITEHQWAGKTFLRLRGTMNYSKRPGVPGGWLRHTDAHGALVNEGRIMADTDAVREVANWVLSLGDVIRVKEWHPDPDEARVASQFARLLQRIRSGKGGLPLFSLPLAPRLRPGDIAPGKLNPTP